MAKDQETYKIYYRPPYLNNQDEYLPLDKALDQLFLALINLEKENLELKEKLNALENKLQTLTL